MEYLDYIECTMMNGSNITDDWLALVDRRYMLEIYADFIQCIFVLYNKLKTKKNYVIWKSSTS